MRDSALCETRQRRVPRALELLLFRWRGDARDSDAVMREGSNGTQANDVEQ